MFPHEGTINKAGLLVANRITLDLTRSSMVSNIDHQGTFIVNQRFIILPENYTGSKMHEGPAVVYDMLELQVGTELQ